MRRISWIDQRIRNVWSEGAAVFFGRPDICLMADESHYGEGEHDERDMAVPAMPGARFVVIETEFVLGGFKTVLDGPAAAFDRYELFHGRALGTPRGEEGEVAVGNVAADQQTPRPFPREGAVVFAGLEIGPFEIGPWRRKPRRHRGPAATRAKTRAFIVR